MKGWLIILLSFCYCLAGRTQARQPGPADGVRMRIDSLENQAISHLSHKNDSTTDLIASLAAQALLESRRIGYSHGIAVALACQAFLMNMHANDFTRSEQLARESLDWFGRTDNKYSITLAYYTLGFSLFAQSRFDEALYNYGQAREYAHRTGNCTEEIYMISLTGQAYRERGDYEKAFDVLRQCIQMASAIHDTPMVKSLYLTLAGMFVQIEDYGSAEKYFRMGFGDNKPEHRDLWDLMAYTELLTRQHKYDSALYYYDRMDSARLGQATFRKYLASKGEYYLCREDYATALPYFIKSLSYQRQLNDGNQMMRCLQDLSKTYAGLGRNDSAFRYAREGLMLAKTANARQNIRDGCQMLYTLYDREGRTDSAYFYYRRYIILKDSVLNDQLKGKFASYGFEQQIALLNKEKQLTEACIRDDMLTKRLLIGGLIALLLIGFVFSRYMLQKRKNEAHRRKRAENELEIQRLEGERAKAALQQRAKELEVQALRSQMNPHFIFNCLNAINRFILGHETEAASDYLTKFSRLMRMIMNHSRYSVISLEEELEVLQLYLDMERLRFKNAFDYTIVLDEETDAGDIYIPPLLLQPFVENAVWHGLMHKEERGALTVAIHAHNDLLTCIIQDNGVGRTRAATLKSKSAQKHKSMGLQITAERLALLTDNGAPGHFFDIEDLYDEQGNPAGTKVVLKIRISSPAGEFV
ncbi:MAG TPA: histidine kinase [Puia sp.]|nr:histidine kinase [Puia sp.]